MKFETVEAGVGRKAGGFIVVALLHSLFFFLLFLFAGNIKNVHRAAMPAMEVRLIAESTRAPQQEVEPITPPVNVAEFRDVPIPELDQVEIPELREETRNALVPVNDGPHYVIPAKQFILPASFATAANAVPRIVDLTQCKPVDSRKSKTDAYIGIVAVKFVIDTDNRLLDASIYKSSGFEEIDQITLNALNHCKFSAAVRNGQAVKASFVVDYAWR